MVSTSISPVATFDCFCRSCHQTQHCSYDFLLILALMGILTILLTLSETRGVLHRMLKHIVHYMCSMSHCSLVDLYCYGKMSHSTQLISLSTVCICVLWKTIIYPTFICTVFSTVFVSFKFLLILAMQKVKAVNETPTKRLVTNSLKEKYHKYQQHCEIWIDYRILRLTLIEMECKVPYRSDDMVSTEFLWDYFEKGDGFEKFVNCLKSSLKRPSFFHLGHHSLHQMLTKETENIIESDDYICNMKIKEIILGDICRFIELVNVQELLPELDSKCLLTNHDKDLLNLKAYTSKADYLLTELLPTKGHCGYNLFLECLENEYTHAGHREMVETIKTELHKCQTCRPPKCSESLTEIQIWYRPGLMDTLEYIEAIEKFMYLSQSNNAQKFYSEIKAFIVSHNRTTEAEAFGFMMKALSLKYRCKDLGLRGMVHQTNQYINRIEEEDTKRDMKGIWNLILSCWYRNQGNFQKAKLYLQQAKPELTFGNGRALVLYSEASLLTETNVKEHKKIITLLKDAIRGFHSKSDIMQARCYLQVAHCYMGCRLSSPCIARRSSADLKMADSILNKLEKQLLNALPLRIKMHYYTIMCDYHRVHNRKEEAIECKLKGLSLDASNQFLRDKKYLQDRLPIYLNK